MPPHIKELYRNLGEEINELLKRGIDYRRQINGLIAERDHLRAALEEVAGATSAKDSVKGLAMFAKIALRDKGAYEPPASADDAYNLIGWDWGGPGLTE